MNVRDCVPKFSKEPSPLERLAEGEEVMEDWEELGTWNLSYLMYSDGVPSDGNWLTFYLRN